MGQQRYFQPSGEPTIMTVCTWATLPGAVDYSGKRIRVTDIGIGGIDMISNGTRWVPVNEHILLDYFANSLVKAPTLTSVTQGVSNLTVVLGTAVPATFSKCFMYFAAGQLYSDDGGNAAGFYYAEMSDTSNATVYSDTYTPATGTRPTIPTTATSITGKTAATGGALAGSTDTITYFQTSVPAGLLGPRGVVLTKTMLETNVAAGNKTYTTVFGGATASSMNLSTQGNCYGEHIIRNRAVDAQRTSAGYQNTANNAGVYSLAVDTSAAVTISYTMATAAATNLCACSGTYINAGVFI